MVPGFFFYLQYLLECSGHSETNLLNEWQLNCFQQRFLFMTDDVKIVFKENSRWGYPESQIPGIAW